MSDRREENEKGRKKIAIENGKENEIGIEIAGEKNVGMMNDVGVMNDRVAEHDRTMGGESR